MKKGQVCLYFFVAALMFVAVFLSGFLSFGAENCFSLPDKAQDETFEGYEGGRYVYVGGAVESTDVPTAAMQYLGFNLSRTPLNDAAVRRANS